MCQGPEARTLLVNINAINKLYKGDETGPSVVEKLPIPQAYFYKRVDNLGFRYF